LEIGIATPDWFNYLNRSHFNSRADFPVVRVQGVAICFAFDAMRRVFKVSKKSVAKGERVQRKKGRDPFASIGPALSIALSKAVLNANDMNGIPRTQDLAQATVPAAKELAIRLAAVIRPGQL